MKREIRFGSLRQIGFKQWRDAVPCRTVSVRKIAHSRQWEAAHKRRVTTTDLLTRMFNLQGEVTDLFKGSQVSPPAGTTKHIRPPIQSQPRRHRPWGSDESWPTANWATPSTLVAKCCKIFPLASDSGLRQNYSRVDTGVPNRLLSST